MKRVAVISAILERPEDTQHPFNDIIASYKHMIRGRMGLPLIEEGMTIVSLTVVGELDEINSLTGKLGRLEYTQIKTSISKKEL